MISEPGLLLNFYNCKIADFVDGLEIFLIESISFTWSRTLGRTYLVDYNDFKKNIKNQKTQVETRLSGVDSPSSPP